MRVPLAVVTDAHLRPGDPGSWAPLIRLLDVLPRPAELVSLGDFFDVWYRPLADHRREYGDLLDALAAAAREGVTCHMLAGNRDFLFTRDDARELGLQWHDEPWDLEVAGRRVRFIHGDRLLTGDTGYQRYRRLVRRPWVTGFARAAPRGLVDGIVGAVRRRSSRNKSAKPGDSWEVDLDEARRILGDADELICGHTHIPRQDDLGDGRTLRVLPAFEDNGEYLAPDADGVWQVRTMTV